MQYNKNTYNSAEVFEGVFQKLCSDKLLNMQDKSELPIYIQTYPIEHEEEVAKQLAFLSQRLRKNDIQVSDINLYQIVLDILRNDGVLDDIFAYEAESEKRDILETITPILSVDRIMKNISSIVTEETPKVILLSGIAPVYPYLRAHNILNNISTELNKTPIVLFYPGTYNNEQLVLFGAKGETGVDDENYYRAHNLSNIKID